MYVPAQWLSAQRQWQDRPCSFLDEDPGEKKTKKWAYKLLRHSNYLTQLQQTFLHHNFKIIKRCVFVCVPHILLDVLAPEVYLPAVVPAPAAPLGLLISKSEAVVPPACNGTSSYGQSPDYSKTCEASDWCYVTSRQGSDVYRRGPAVGWSSSPGPSSACETHSDFASSAETLSKSENREKIRSVLFQMEKCTIILVLSDYGSVLNVFEINLHFFFLIDYKWWAESNFDNDSSLVLFY